MASYCVVGVGGSDALASLSEEIKAAEIAGCVVEVREVTREKWGGVINRIRSRLSWSIRPGSAVPDAIAWSGSGRDVFAGAEFAQFLSRQREVVSGANRDEVAAGSVSLSDDAQAPSQANADFLARIAKRQQLIAQKNSDKDNAAAQQLNFMKRLVKFIANPDCVCVDS